MAGGKQNRAPEVRAQEVPVQLGRRAGHFPSDPKWINSLKIEGENRFEYIKIIFLKIPPGSLESWLRKLMSQILITSLATPST